MKKIFTILLIIITCEVNAQNTFAVWQGFSNYWTYNHRLNRLGDFVSQSSENANKHFTITHTAATGLGKDSAYFQSNYAIVESENISFFAGKINFQFSGKEGNTIKIKKNINFKLSENLKEKDIFVSILNGFDITAIASADKLTLLEINIENPILNTTTNTLDFSIEATLNTDCKSLECNWFHDIFDYSLNIHYLIIGANKNEISSQEIPYYQKTNWDKKTEIVAQETQHSLAFNSDFENGLLAYKNISIEVDHQQHYLGFENKIDQVLYNKNKLFYTTTLFYSNWKNNMQKSVASGKQALFSYRSAGWCVQKGVFNFIQFNDGAITYHNRKGSMYWQGKNKSAFDNDAVNAVNVFYK